MSSAVELYLASDEGKATWTPEKRAETMTTLATDEFYTDLPEDEKFEVFITIWMGTHDKSKNKTYTAFYEEVLQNKKTEQEGEAGARRTLSTRIRTRPVFYGEGKHEGTIHVEGPELAARAAAKAKASRSPSKKKKNEWDGLAGIAEEAVDAPPEPVSRVGSRWVRASLAGQPSDAGAGAGGAAVDDGETLEYIPPAGAAAAAPARASGAGAAPAGGGVAADGQGGKKPPPKTEPRARFSMSPLFVPSNSTTATPAAAPPAAAESTRGGWVGDVHPPPPQPAAEAGTHPPHLSVLSQRTAEFAKQSLLAHYALFPRLFDANPADEDRDEAIDERDRASLADDADDPFRLSPFWKNKTTLVFYDTRTRRIECELISDTSAENESNPRVTRYKTSPYSIAETLPEVKHELLWESTTEFQGFWGLYELIGEHGRNRLATSAAGAFRGPRECDFDEYTCAYAFDVMPFEVRTDDDIPPAFCGEYNAQVEDVADDVYYHTDVDSQRQYKCFKNNTHWFIAEFDSVGLYKEICRSVRQTGGDRFKAHAHPRLVQEWVAVTGGRSTPYQLTTLARYPLKQTPPRTMSRSTAGYGRDEEVQKLTSSDRLKFIYKSKTVEYIGKVRFTPNGNRSYLSYPNRPDAKTTFFEAKPDNWPAIPYVETLQMIESDQQVVVFNIKDRTVVCRMSWDESTNKFMSEVYVQRMMSFTDDYKWWLTAQDKGIVSKEGLHTMHRHLPVVGKGFFLAREDADAPSHYCTHARNVDGFFLDGENYERQNPRVTGIYTCAHSKLMVLKYPETGDDDTPQHTFYWSMQRNSTETHKSTAFRRTDEAFIHPIYAEFEVVSALLPVPDKITAAVAALCGKAAAVDAMADAVDAKRASGIEPSSDDMHRIREGRKDFEMDKKAQLEGYVQQVRDNPILREFVMHQVHVQRRSARQQSPQTQFSAEIDFSRRRALDRVEYTTGLLMHQLYSSASPLWDQIQGQDPQLPDTMRSAIALRHLQMTHARELGRIRRAAVLERLKATRLAHQSAQLIEHVDREDLLVAHRQRRTGHRELDAADDIDSRASTPARGQERPRIAEAAAAPHVEAAETAMQTLEARAEAAAARLEESARQSDVLLNDMHRRRKAVIAEESRIAAIAMHMRTIEKAAEQDCIDYCNDAEEMGRRMQESARLLDADRNLTRDRLQTLQERIVVLNGTITRCEAQITSAASDMQARRSTDEAEAAARLDGLRSELESAHAEAARTHDAMAELTRKVEGLEHDLLLRAQLKATQFDSDIQALAESAAAYETSAKGSAGRAKTNADESFKAGLRASREADRAGHQADLAGRDAGRAGREADRAADEADDARGEAEAAARYRGNAEDDAEQTAASRDAAADSAFHSLEESQRSGREADRAGLEADRATEQADDAGRDADRASQHADEAAESAIRLDDAVAGAEESQGEAEVHAFFASSAATGAWDEREDADRAARAAENDRDRAAGAADAAAQDAEDTAGYKDVAVKGTRAILKLGLRSGRAARAAETDRDSAGSAATAAEGHRDRAAGAATAAEGHETRAGTASTGALQGISQALEDSKAVSAQLMAATKETARIAKLRQEIEEATTKLQRANTTRFGTEEDLATIRKSLAEVQAQHAKLQRELKTKETSVRQRTDALEKALEAQQEERAAAAEASKNPAKGPVPAQPEPDTVRQLREDLAEARRVLASAIQLAQENKKKEDDAVLRRNELEELVVTATGAQTVATREYGALRTEFERAATQLSQQHSTEIASVRDDVQRLRSTIPSMQVDGAGNLMVSDNALRGEVVTLRQEMSAAVTRLDAAVDEHRHSGGRAATSQTDGLQSDVVALQGDVASLRRQVEHTKTSVESDMVLLRLSLVQLQDELKKELATNDTKTVDSISTLNAQIQDITTRLRRLEDAAAHLRDTDARAIAAAADAGPAAPLVIETSPDTIRLRQEIAVGMAGLEDKAAIMQREVDDALAKQSAELRKYTMDVVEEKVQELKDQLHEDYLKRVAVFRDTRHTMSLQQERSAIADILQLQKEDAEDVLSDRFADAFLRYLDANTTFVGPRMPQNLFQSITSAIKQHWTKRGRNRRASLAVLLALLTAMSGYTAVRDVRGPLRRRHTGDFFVENTGDVEDDNVSENTSAPSALQIDTSAPSALQIYRPPQTPARPNIATQAIEFGRRIYRRTMGIQQDDMEEEQDDNVNADQVEEEFDNAVMPLPRRNTRSNTVIPAYPGPFAVKYYKQCVAYVDAVAADLADAEAEERAEISSTGVVSLKIKRKLNRLKENWRSQRNTMREQAVSAAISQQQQFDDLAAMAAARGGVSYVAPAEEQDDDAAMREPAAPRIAAIDSKTGLTVPPASPGQFARRYYEGYVKKVDAKAAAIAVAQREEEAELAADGVVSVKTKRKLNTLKENWRDLRNTMREQAASALVSPQQQRDDLAEMAAARGGVPYAPAAVRVPPRNTGPRIPPQALPPPFGTLPVAPSPGQQITISARPVDPAQPGASVRPPGGGADDEAGAGTRVLPPRNRLQRTFYTPGTGGLGPNELQKK